MSRAFEPPGQIPYTLADLKAYAEKLGLPWTSVKVQTRFALDAYRDRMRLGDLDTAGGQRSAARTCAE